MAGIPFELKGKTVFVAGHGGMVGAALMRRLALLMLLGDCVGTINYGNLIDVLNDGAPLMLAAIGMTLVPRPRIAVMVALSHKPNGRRHGSPHLAG